LIPAFDPSTGALPPGNHQATLEQIRMRLGFTPRRQWLLKGLRAAVEAFWAAGIQEIYIDGSFCTEKPDPGDIDGYWVEPDVGVYDRIDPYWVDFELVLVPLVRKWKWAHVERLWGRVLHSSGDAGNSGIGISGVLSAEPGRATAGRNSGGQGW
jgi:hypothetical protein